MAQGSITEELGNRRLQRGILVANARDCDEVGMGLDASLPFFAYGMFGRGELGWLRVRDFVVRLASAIVAGELLERDGLVILDPQGAGQVPGMVAFFDSQLASQAYAAIDELEPEHQYSWTVLEAQVAEAKTTVNALVGRSPRKGSKPLEGPWSGRTDPLLNAGLATVEQLIGESRVTSDRDGFLPPAGCVPSPVERDRALRLVPVRDQRRSDSPETPIGCWRAIIRAGLREAWLPS